MVTTDKVYEENEKIRQYKEDDKLGGYDPYSGSKAGAEMVINSYIKSFFNPKDYDKKHKTLVASARSGNVIGGGDWLKDRIMPDIIRSIFGKKEKLILRNPNSTRPWQHVLEPLYGYMLLAKKLYEGKKGFSGAWNFGPNNKNYLTVGELTEKVIGILRQGSYAVKRDLTKHEAAWLRLNIDKSKNILNWRPVLDINETLKLTLDWYKSFYNRRNVINLTDKQIEFFFNKISKNK
jgi:CDP-glucose 4,6-dehydratase